MTPEPGMALVVPGTGEVLDLSDTRGMADAYTRVQELERELQDARRALADGIVEASSTWGGRTMHLPDGRTIVISGGSEWVYDALAIEEELLAAGMPQERVDQIVTQTVSYRVDAAKAKQAAGANPAYAAIIERNRTRVSKRPSVAVK